MKKIIVTTILFGLSMIFYSCQSGLTGLRSADDLVEELGLNRLPTQADYPNDDAVVLKSITEVKMEITSTYDIVTYETFSISRLVFDNVEDYAEVTIPIYSSEEIESIEAQVIKPDGTVIPVPSEEFYKSEGESDNSSFYTDRKSIKFTYPSAAENCILQYTVRKIEYWPFAMGRWLVQYSDPVISNSYYLTVPHILLKSKANGGLGWNWNYKSYNFFADNPKLLEKIDHKQHTMNETRTYYWVMNNVPPFRYEPQMSAVDNYIRYVKFSPHYWKKWDDITDWYYEKFTEKLKENTGIEEKTKAIINESGATTEAEKLNALYTYVRNLRYVSISLGEGSIIPSTPETILKHEYGDCKDKSTLLISMLKEVGIKAQPVLVLTADEGTLDPTFPSWNFNHMIVKVLPEEGKPVFLDPTSRYSEVGDLPWQCEGISVLVLNENGDANVEQTPSSDFGTNEANISVDVTINKDGSADFDVVRTMNGEFNTSFRYLLDRLTEQEIEDYCRNMVVDNFVNAEINNITYSDPDAEGEEAEISFSFSVKNAIQTQGDLHMLNTDPFKLLQSMDFLNKKSRNYHIDFEFPFAVRKNISIHIPDDTFSIRNIPENMNLGTKYFTYKKEINQSEASSINASEIFIVRRPLIPPSAYEDTKDMFEKIQKKLDEKLILLKI